MLNTFDRSCDSLLLVIIAILAGKKKAQLLLYNANTGMAICQEEVIVISRIDIMFMIPAPIRRVLLPIRSSNTPLGSISSVDASPPILITKAFWFVFAPISAK